MTVVVTCPKCDADIETYYGESGVCPYCERGRISAPAHPALAA